MNAATLNRVEETLAVEPTNHYAQNELRAAEATDKRIKKLVKEVRARRARIAYQEEKLDSLRDELQTLLEAQGSNWADPDGYARLIPESKRVSYDAKSIDQLIAREPGFDCLRAYRRESAIHSSVQVR